MEATPQTALAHDLQAGQALTIRRKFTSPGVHPFDTVEWELRDARIGHGDRVAFEQTDVEFPRTWSQNATNRPPATSPRRTTLSHDGAWPTYSMPRSYWSE